MSATQEVIIRLGPEEERPRRLKRVFCDRAAFENDFIEGWDVDNKPVKFHKSTIMWDSMKKTP